MRLLLRSVAVLSMAGLWLSATSDPEAELRSFIKSKMPQARVPGLAVAVVKHGQVVYVEGFGEADVASHRAATADTAFRVASVSKTFTATALMQLEEHGAFQLDADINTALPFSVRSPHALQVPLTYRMLLTHTAGIADNYVKIDPLWNWQGDAAMALPVLEQGYFSSAGSLFSDDNFLASAPGVESAYSNMGIGLAGYLLERLSGKPFVQAVEDAILHPLQLNSAAWSVAAAAPGGLATLYQWDGHHYEALSQYGYPEVPAGMLRISARDLARFMIVHTSGGASGGVRILSASTTAEMQRVQLPEVDQNQGLVFYHLFSSDGQYPLVGHNGGDPGVSAEMYWVDGDPAQLGVLVLANSDATSDDDHPERGEAIYAILDKLLHFGAGL